MRKRVPAVLAATMLMVLTAWYLVLHREKRTAGESVERVISCIQDKDPAFYERLISVPNMPGATAFPEEFGGVPMGKENLPKVMPGGAWFHQVSPKVTLLISTDGGIKAYWATMPEIERLVKSPRN